jgi:uncharacterized protein (DUF433 family)
VIVAITRSFGRSGHRAPCEVYRLLARAGGRDLGFGRSVALDRLIKPSDVDLADGRGSAEMNINTDHIWTEVGRYGGKPYIRGHRFTVVQMLAELARGCTVGELAAGYEIGQNKFVGALHDLGTLLNESESVAPF